MKIVDRKTFLSLPENTIFSKFELCFFGKIAIKGKSIGLNNSYYREISDAVKCNDSGEFIDVLLDATENGTHFEMDLYCEGMDGLFNKGQLFAVWEKEDVIQLIERLKEIVE
jgi:hypothetical protein